MTTNPKRTICDVRGCRRWKTIKPLDSRYVGTMLRVGPRLCPQHTQDAIDGSNHRHFRYDSTNVDTTVYYYATNAAGNWNETWSNTA